MTDIENISAYIVENLNPLILNVSLSNILDSKNEPYLLVVKSATIECIRLTIYPIEKEKIVKISLTGTDSTDNFLEITSKILQNYNVLHSSGVFKRGDHIHYECFLNLNKSDVKYKDLIASIDKIRYIFKEIKIEEIGLKKA